MATSNYNFYMQKVNKDGTAIDGEESKDLEKDFSGLLYVEAKGISTIGKQRIYTETFVDEDAVDVYIPEPPRYEATSIDLTLIFVGETRYATYNDFNDYIKEGFHKFWDTARKREFVFYVEDEISVAEEMWHGSTPYLKVTYKLNNIKGYTDNKS